MHIGGFQKNSLIDFPGQIASVVFTTGCNFICPYCHNPDLAAGPVPPPGGDRAGARVSPYTEEEILAFLNKRQGMIQGVAVTGGEPTLQKDLASFLIRIREMGFHIKLDSNGTRPGVLASLFDKGLVDYLAMDIKTDLAHYPMVMKNKKDGEKVRESISLVMEQAPAYEFRTTCARPFITPEKMARIAREIQGANLYVLQQCTRSPQVLDPEFSKEDSHFFTEKEMTELRAMIAPFVREVSIR